MGGEILTSVLAFLDAYQTIILSLSLAVLGGLVLVLWFRIYRSHACVSELLVKSMETGKMRTAKMELLGEETKRQVEMCAEELRRVIDEERVRINGLQKLLVEVKEKQFANNRVMERSIQTVVNQLSERMDVIEKRLPYDPGNMRVPQSRADGDNEEKGKFLV